MKTYIVFFILLLVGFLFYKVYPILQARNKRLCVQSLCFQIENIEEDPIVVEYLDKMQQQRKDNSRVIDGSGKMHFTTAIVEGSQYVREKNISVLSCIGERFS